MAGDISQRVASLESKVQELEELVNLALRLLAISNPVAALLKTYGATESETRAVHALLDDVAVRAEKGGMSAPSYGGFVNHLFELLPSSRGNHEFVSLLIEALQADRPAYQKLYSYVAVNWTDRPK
jgi:hypothetical protein